jgi:hypothetical protein
MPYKNTVKISAPAFQRFLRKALLQKAFCARSLDLPVNLLNDSRLLLEPFSAGEGSAWFV